MKKSIVVATLLAAAVSSAAAADPVRLRIGWAQVPTQMTPLVAELAKSHPELFRNLNVTYTYEPVRFQGSPPQILTFATNEIEVAAFGPIQRDIDTAVSMKMLPERIDVIPRYVDLSLIADAKARLDAR